MTKVSTWMLEKGIQTPSPSPDHIPAQNHKLLLRTYMETGTSNGGTSPKLDGNHLRATVVEVNYAPGEGDKPHSHPCTVIGYVAQGAIRFQVKGGPEGLFKAGESFYEPPNGVHQVSANASDKEPAKLIAFFVCDHETPLTVPPVDSHAGHEAK